MWATCVGCGKVVLKYYVKVSHVAFCSSIVGSTTILPSLSSAFTPQVGLHRHHLTSNIDHGCLDVDPLIAFDSLHEFIHSVRYRETVFVVGFGHLSFMIVVLSIFHPHSACPPSRTVANLLP